MIMAEACNFIKKETLAPVFTGVLTGEFCEISKNTFFHRTTLVAASGLGMSSNNFSITKILYNSACF